MFKSICGLFTNILLLVYILLWTDAYTGVEVKVSRQSDSSQIIDLYYKFALAAHHIPVPLQGPLYSKRHVPFPTLLKPLWGIAAEKKTINVTGTDCKAGC